MKGGFLFRRLNDPAQSFQEKSSLRFSLKNPYDFIVYAYPNYFALELKSIQGNGITFWREGLPDKGQYMIKRNQIEGLQKDAEYPGSICGFVLNFRDTNHTYFLSIGDFLALSQGVGKKSFNESDLAPHNPVLINQRLKRTAYDYDVAGLIHTLQTLYNKEEKNGIRRVQL